MRFVGVRDDVQTTVVTGIEMFRKQLDEAQAGDNIGALLRGINRDQIVRGQVLAKPGTVTCHHKFTAQVYVLTKDEGGRHTPFFNNYRPQFYFRTTDVTGVCNLPAGTEMCMPGDNVEMTIELIHPVAMEQGLTFAIREGGTNCRFRPCCYNHRVIKYYSVNLRLPGFSLGAFFALKWETVAAGIWIGGCRRGKL